MKKLTIFLLVLALLLTPVLTAAAELEGCVISADSVVGEPGGSVTVPIRISGNPGFTNLAVALDYDREQLTLVSIQLAEGETPYLCGETAAANTAWAPGNPDNEAFAEDTLYGYVTCAAPQTIAEDGVLFTATFTLSEAFSGEAQVTPIVTYIRSNMALASVFEEISADIQAGTVTLETESVLIGDVNGDGFITAGDASAAFAASINSDALTDIQKTAADVNGDGFITAADASQIFVMSVNES